MKRILLNIFVTICVLEWHLTIPSVSRGEETAELVFRQATDLMVAELYEQAEPKLKQAITLADAEIHDKPQRASIYLIRAEAKSCFTRYTLEEILADVDRAIQLEPDAAEGYHIRGKLLLNKKRTVPALNDLKKAIEIDSTKWYYYNVCGFCQMNLEDYDAAIANFNEAIRLNPESWNSFQLRAESRYFLRAYEIALKDFLEAHRLVKSPSRRLLYTTGECHYQLAQYRLAIQFMQKTLDGSQEDVGGLLYLGHCHYALKEWEMALGHYDRALKLNPNDGLLYYCRALVFKELGQSLEESEALKKARQLGYKP